MELTFSLETSANPEKIWDFYADINKWRFWEEDLENINLEGSFINGTKGVMKLKNMPEEIHFTLSSVIKNQEFWDKTTLPFGELIFGHQIISVDEKIYIKHIVRLKAVCNETNVKFLQQVFSDVPRSVMLLKMVAQQC